MKELRVDFEGFFVVFDGFLVHLHGSIKLSKLPVGQIAFWVGFDRFLVVRNDSLGFIRFSNLASLCHFHPKPIFDDFRVFLKLLLQLLIIHTHFFHQHQNPILVWITKMSVYFNGFKKVLKRLVIITIILYAWGFVIVSFMEHRIGLDRLFIAFQRSNYIFVEIGIVSSLLCEYSVVCGVFLMELWQL